VAETSKNPQRPGVYQAEPPKTAHKKSRELVRRLGLGSRVVDEQEMLEMRWDCAPRRGHGYHRDRTPREPLPQHTMPPPAQSGAEPCAMNPASATFRVGPTRDVSPQPINQIFKLSDVHRPTCPALTAAQNQCWRIYVALLFRVEQK
jgi:hypothetical protein